MSSPSRALHRAASAASNVTGTRFAVLVASSLVATSVVVASALSNPSGPGPLAALLGQAFGGESNRAGVGEPSEASASAPAPEAAASPPAASPAPAPGGANASAEAPRPSGEAPSESPPAPPPPPSAPTVGRIKHVFVISLTSPGYEAAFGTESQMPYLAGTLRPAGTMLSGYSLLDSSGIANSIAAVGGQPPNAETKAGCPTFADFPPGTAADRRGVVRGSGCVYPVEALSLADQLTSARLTWRAYMEGMTDEGGQPHDCVHPGSGEAQVAAASGYQSTQNPFAYFHSLLDLGGCAIDDVPLEELSADLRDPSKTPNYSFIAPTPCDAGALGQCPAGGPGGGANGDAFLSKWVPAILASQAYKKDGLLIVTFNAVTAEPEGVEPEAGALKVGTLLLSRFVTKGATESAPYDPYALFRTSEELFGLTPLAEAADPKTKTFAPQLLGETGGD